MGCGAEATGLGFGCFVVPNPRLLSANKVDLGFLFHTFSNFTPPPPPRHTHLPWSLLESQCLPFWWSGTSTSWFILDKAPFVIRMKIYQQEELVSLFTLSDDLSHTNSDLRDLSADFKHSQLELEKYQKSSWGFSVYIRDSDWFCYSYVPQRVFWDSTEPNDHWLWHSNGKRTETVGQLTGSCNGEGCCQRVGYRILLSREIARSI